MEPTKRAVLGQGASVVSMVALIYLRISYPDPTAAEIFHVDWLIMFAALIIVLQVGLFALSMRSAERFGTER